MGRSLRIRSSKNFVLLKASLMSFPLLLPPSRMVINSSIDNATEATTDEPSDNNSCDNNHPIHPASRIQKDHPVDNIIGQLDQGMKIRWQKPVEHRKMVGLIGESCFISKVEPKNVDEALKDEHWISAMQEELV
ncbi:hypothetical protein LIER_10415 [Lithospermum erythrorhizon]|uniref:Mitochondrial protein n=1 Tax=Lithospermum erythrorhizon TaxID=34254 RepID=A0AAV3PL77_LITER